MTITDPVGFWDRDTIGDKEFVQDNMNACLLQKNTFANLDLIDDHDGMMAFEEDGGRFFRNDGTTLQVLDFIQSGLDAAKPAGISANDGKIYAATDTQILYKVISAALTKIATGKHAGLDDVTSDQHHTQVHTNAEHTVGTPSDIGTSNTEGASANSPRLDHVHDHPSGLGVDLHHNQTHGSGEHTVGTPSDIGSSNAAGASANTPRLDHQHNHPSGLGINLHHNEDHDSAEHTVGTPSDIGTSNAEGVSTSVPRLDHQHNHPTGLDTDLHHNQSHTMADHTTGTPANVGTVNAQGASTAIPRLDHVHAHVSGLGVNLHHNENHVTEHKSGGDDVLPNDDDGVADATAAMRKIAAGGVADFAHGHTHVITSGKTAAFGNDNIACSRDNFGTSWSSSNFALDTGSGSGTTPVCAVVVMASNSGEAGTAQLVVDSVVVDSEAFPNADELEIIVLTALVNRTGSENMSVKVVSMISGNRMALAGVVFVPRYT